MLHGGCARWGDDRNANGCGRSMALCLNMPVPVTLEVDAPLGVAPLGVAPLGVAPLGVAPLGVAPGPGQHAVHPGEGQLEMGGLLPIAAGIELLPERRCCFSSSRLRLF